MKKRKALLPILTGALILSLGLGACGGKPANNQGGSNGGSTPASEPVEVKINITAEGGKKEIIVGETLQLTADVEGVEWSTKSEGIISVDAKGLVTALGVGAGRVTARKEGYANGTYTITVNKAPERQWKYELRLEEADHYDPDDFWGMDLSQWGYGIMGPGESPVENNGVTDDGTSLGYLQTGCKETMTFTSDKATQVEIGVTMAYNAETALEGVITVKFNGVEISMANRACEGPENGDTNNYYDFHAVSFGNVNLVAGNNVLEIEVLGTVAPNMDKVVIWTEETLAIAAVPAPVKPKIEVVEAELTVIVEETAQIQVKNNLAGVAFKSADETIATVSATGLVTGVKAGRTTVELTKDGYKKATVNVIVKAKPVAGQIILEAEEGTGGTVENDANASGGARVGYLSAGTTLVLKTTLEAAGEYTATMMAYSNNVADWSGYPNVTADELDLSTCMTLKVNNVDVDLTGKVLPGGAWGTWVEVSFGDFNLIAGENTFELAFTAQGPNIDYIKLVNKNGGEVTPPVVEKFNVSFDANGGTGEMAAVEVEKGEYTLPACAFTAPTDKVFAGWEIPVNQWQTQVKQPGEKINVTADVTIKATWKAANVTVSFNANGGTGEMAAVTVPSGEYELPACTFTAPVGCTFAGWEITVQVNQWQTSKSIKQAGDKITVDADMTIKAVWNYTKDTEVDLSSGVYFEAEDAKLGGAAQAETNQTAHGGNSVGYMSANASITFEVQAEAAGKATLVLLASNVGTWSFQGTTYDSNTPIDGAMTVKVNGVNVSVAGKGINMSEEGAWVQINLGEIDLIAGKNEIVLAASAQTVNVDAIVLLTNVAVSQYVEVEVLPEGMIYVEAEDGVVTGGSVESKTSAHGKKSVGNFSAGATLTITFNASAAGKVVLSMVGATCNMDMSDWQNMKMLDHDLAASLTMTINGNAIDLTGKTLPGCSGMNFENWQEVEIGEIDVQAGLNTIVITATAQGPNFDFFKIQGNASVVVSNIVA